MVNHLGVPHDPSSPPEGQPLGRALFARGLVRRGRQAPRGHAQPANQVARNKPDYLPNFEDFAAKFELDLSRGVMKSDSPEDFARMH